MKYSHSKTLNILTLVLTGLSPLASAQDKVNMLVDLVSWGDTIEGLSIVSGGKKLPAAAHAFTYSKPVRYQGPRILEIHSKLEPGVIPSKPDPVSEPKLSELEKRRVETPDLIALATLPVDSSRVTILLAPDSNGTYVCHVIDDDPAKLPKGKLRVHNLSPLPISLRFNQKSTSELAAQESAVVTPVKQMVVYELAYNQDGRWRLQENNLIHVAPENQVQFIILRSENDFFTSGDGSRGGFLQTVTLTRTENQQPPTDTDTDTDTE